MSLDFDEILAQARPKTTTVRVCLRGDLLAEHEKLERQLAEARRLDETENRHAEAPGIAEQIRALEAQIDAAEIPFEFTAVSAKQWSDLRADHAPRDEDRDAGFDFNQDTFPQVAIAASCTSPRMTVAQVEKLMATLSTGQLAPLLRTALLVNVGGTSIPFSAAASAVLRGTATRSGLPTTIESPAASSSDE